MPSFDIVSEVDTHELTNAVHQANRELPTRFDFKGVDARFVRELAKKIQATLKEAKLKVDSQINDDKLRVNGKKRDDLQAAIALLRGQEFELPLQFDNFRD